MWINGKFVAVAVAAIQSIVINCVLSQKENANRENILSWLYSRIYFYKMKNKILANHQPDL